MKFRFSWKFAISAVLTVFCAAVIFWFSAQCGDDSSSESSRLVLWLLSAMNIPKDQTVIDVLTFIVRKSAHMTEYALLGILTLNTLRCGFGTLNKRLYCSAFALASFYAATDEIHQLFVPGRSGQIVDWVIDSTGIILGLMFFFAVSCLVNSVKIKSVKEN